MNATNTIGKIIELPKIVDLRGNLTVAESSTNIPFDIKRAYWVYDVPGGESRGAHAHKELQQLIIAANGSFTITLDIYSSTSLQLRIHAKLYGLIFSIN